MKPTHAWLVIAGDWPNSGKPHPLMNIFNFLSFILSVVDLHE